jgi:hypothetical protein
MLVPSVALFIKHLQVTQWSVAVKLASSGVGQINVGERIGRGTEAGSGVKLRGPEKQDVPGR